MVGRSSVLGSCVWCCKFVAFIAIYSKMYYFCILLPYELQWSQGILREEGIYSNWETIEKYGLKAAFIYRDVFFYKMNIQLFKWKRNITLINLLLALWSKCIYFFDNLIKNLVIKNSHPMMLHFLLILIIYPKWNWDFWSK